ncbi:DUF5131 family protein [Holdemania filiformis]|uniref:DUF5131 family protein n=1 Tax=Holdemania filiformis TaxID=61171 RepID=UPI002431638D|nr:DUF5131 family protein [Holdemania filiformis]
MHDIWNPWHGCTKISEGCEHCYMYFLDHQRGQNGAQIRRVAGGGDMPVKKDRRGYYKIQSGERVRVCMNSDFFLAEADPWRDEAWQIMKKRSDVIFFLLTKRPERVAACLPADWGTGWENIFFNVTVENQKRAESRMDWLLKLPFQHKGVMCAPLIGPVDLSPWLASGQVEQVICGGENYDGARPCDYRWVQDLGAQCRRAGVTFNFIETGSVFVKDGKTYPLPSKRLQSEMARKSGLSFRGRPQVFHLEDEYGPIPPERLYQPYFGPHCQRCGGQLTCNGCTRCGRCEKKQTTSGHSSRLDPSAGKKD